MAAADRRRLDNTKQPGGMVGPSGPQPPNLTHHHTMNSNVVSQQPNSIANQPSSGRPSLDRAHTFPTPPTSASGTVTGMGNQWNSYESGSGSISNGVAGSFEHHPHSTPATPASTPPGSSLPGLQQSYQGNQHFENTRPMYPATQQPQYAAQQNMQNQTIGRAGSLQSNTYSKQEMGPPATLASTKSESDHSDQKLATYMSNNHDNGHEEADHDQDSEYGQDHKYGYDAHRASYPGMNGHNSLNQSVWPNYQSPRAPPSSNLYNPTSDTRGALPNGNVEHITGPYAPTQLNGVPPSNKRSREDDDYSRQSDDIDALKRRKMSREGAGLTNGSYDNRSKNSTTVRTNRR